MLLPGFVKPRLLIVFTVPPTASEQKYYEYDYNIQGILTFFRGQHWVWSFNIQIGCNGFFGKGKIN